VSVKDSRVTNHLKNGIYVYEGEIEITKTEICDNSEHGTNIEADGHATFYTCRIFRNSLNGINSSGSSTKLINSIVAFNDQEGIIFSSGIDSLVIKNATIAYNDKQGLIAEYSDVKITNSIFYFNGGGYPIVKIMSDIVVNYSDVAGGYEGLGNKNEDPQFLDTLFFQFLIIMIYTIHHH